jgi:hypothetical protein
MPTNEPDCNHDPVALMEVTLLVCECGAYVDPDTGAEFRLTREEV